MTFTIWANDGECVATAKDPISLLPCGPGTQKQTRTCKDGTIEKCEDATEEPLSKSVTCELEKCTGKLGLLSKVMFHNIILKFANYSAPLSIYFLFS